MKERYERNDKDQGGITEYTTKKKSRNITVLIKIIVKAWFCLEYIGIILMTSVFIHFRETRCWWMGGHANWPMGIGVLRKCDKQKDLKPMKEEDVAEPKKEEKPVMNS